MLHGTTVCKGTGALIVGNVRIVHTIADIDSIQTGEIMACAMTAPEWMPAFPKVAAILTETGGVLCHAAIVAREYNTACITGINGLLGELENGMRCIVDVHSGSVAPADSDSEVMLAVKERDREYIGSGAYMKDRWARFGRQDEW